jgi:hypothetical protein
MDIKYFVNRYGTPYLTLEGQTVISDEPHEEIERDTFLKLGGQEPINTGTEENPELVVLDFEPALEQPEDLKGDFGRAYDAAVEKLASGDVLTGEDLLLATNPMAAFSRMKSKVEAA